MKRFLYLIAILAVIGLIIGAFFFFQYRSDSPVQEESSEGTLPASTEPISIYPSEQKNPDVIPDPNTPISLGGGLTIAYPNPVFAFALAPDGDVIIIDPKGKVSILPASAGTAAVAAITLSPTPITNLWKASFSADASKILVLFGNPHAPQSAIFNVATKTWQPFPISIMDGAWAPTGLSVAYITDKNGISSLSTLDISSPNNKSQELFKTHFTDISLAWPESNRIFIYERASSLVPSNAWNFDVKKKGLSSFAIAQRGLITSWFPSSASGLAFIAGDAGKGGNLFLISPQGDVQERFSFLTLPSKCSIAPSSDTRTSSTSALSDSSLLICGIPRNTSALQITSLPDAYYKNSLFTNDAIYAIDLSTGITRTLFDDTTKNFDASSLSSSRTTAYFINRYDKKLYSILIQ
ncbi:MAG: hypothetical protein NUV53_04645 [Patescibacteria group bacterium]|nr:hypothetical protein [Patescibacteria group bacterium]